MVIVKGRLSSAYIKWRLIMTIRHLKIFITVAECGKMNLAAQKLYISQPSVSQAISELEEYYGTKLFERLTQKLYITDSGEKLLSYARHVVDSYENMDAMMKNEGEHPVLRVGGSVTVGTCLLNSMVSRFRRECTAEVKAFVDNTTTIERMILDSSLDVGIVEGIVEDKNIIQIPLCNDELVIVVGKMHPFYNKPFIKLSDLQGQGLVAREDGSQRRNQYEQLLEEKNIQLKNTWSCTNTEAIKNTVISGNDIGILSKMLLTEECKNKSLYMVPVQDVKVNREIKLIYHKNKFISPALEVFIKVTKSHISTFQ